MIDNFSKNLGACWFVPRVIYFDLELLIVPVAGAEPDAKKSISIIFEKHENCGYSLAVVEFEKTDVI